jgi:hypothetical protein
MGSLLVADYCNSLVVSLEFFSGLGVRVSTSVALTTESLLFSAIVCLISGVVFSYSYSYISYYVNYKYFLWTTFGFVLSILVVINFRDLFIVILG